MIRRSIRFSPIIPFATSFLVFALALPWAIGQETAGTSPSQKVTGPSLPDLSVPTPSPLLQEATSTPHDALKTAENEKLTNKSASESTPVPESEDKVNKAAPTPEPASKPSLSKEMTELRDRLRQALAVGYRLPFNTRDNTPSEILDFCLAFGCFAEITDGSSGQKVNGVGALCWNYPCNGYQLFMADENRIMPRIGYGLQRQPSEFLAFLAMSMVNSDYEIRVNEKRGSVADLVNYEKQTCQSGTNLAFKLTGLAYYVPANDSWKNQNGETWSVERLIREELARTPDPSTSDVTDRLMGLSFAVHRQIKRKQPVEGVFRKAQDHLNDYQQYALTLQNADGTWHAEFFALKGNSNDLTGTLRATGRILEWLTFSLPEDQLKDPRTLRSVAYVAQLLASRGASWNLSTMTPRDIDAVMHACQALSTYDQRVFRPLEAETSAEEVKKTKNASLQTPVKLNRFTAHAIGAGSDGSDQSLRSTPE